MTDDEKLETIAGGRGGYSYATVEEMARELQQLRASHEELYKALQLAQWAAFNDSDWGNTVFCTECRRDPKIGHHSECSVMIALANAQKVREG